MKKNWFIKQATKTMTRKILSSLLLFVGLSFSFQLFTTANDICFALGGVMVVFIVLSYFKIWGK